MACALDAEIPGTEGRLAAVVTHKKDRRSSLANKQRQAAVGVRRRCHALASSVHAGTVRMASASGITLSRGTPICANADCAIARWPRSNPSGLVNTAVVG